MKIFPNSSDATRRVVEDLVAAVSSTSFRASVGAGLSIMNVPHVTFGNYITGFFVNQLHLEVGIAQNDAITKNTVALVVGMCIRTATFFVGKPGTSKSLFLSLDQEMCRVASLYKVYGCKKSN